MQKRKISWLLISSALAGVAFGLESDPLAQLSLKNLYGVEITSVSKRRQALEEVAAAVYVIDSDEIRRSGYERLVDLLKTVPGTWLSDLNNSSNTFSIREQADVLPNSVLVLLDGVPVVSPIFSGFNFNTLDIPLERIERIEVIRGPGGTIYGANAASGIISIFTKNSEKEYGTRLNLDAGSGSYGRTHVTHGFDLGESASMFVWGNWKTSAGYRKDEKLTGDSITVDDGGIIGTIGNPFPDDSEGKIRSWSGGGGSQWNILNNVSLSSDLVLSYFEESAYSFHQLPVQVSHETVLDDYWTYTGVFSNRLDWNVSKGHDFFAKFFHRQTYSSSAMLDRIRIGERITELELQDNLSWWKGNIISSGGNIRKVDYDIYNLRDKNVQVTDPLNTEYLLGAFLQNESRLGNLAVLTLGAKAETWTLIGLEPEISPSARILLKAAPGLNLWLAASRSFTTPGYSQTNFDVKTVYYLLGWLTVLNERNPIPTEYRTYEGGLRFFGSELLSLDINSYYVEVRDKVDIDASKLGELVRSPVSGELVFPMYYKAMNMGHYRGGEVVAESRPQDWLNIQASWSIFRSDMKSSVSGVLERNLNPVPPRTPEHVARLSVFLDLPGGFDFSARGFYSTEFFRGDYYMWSVQQYTWAAFVENPDEVEWPSTAKPEYRLDLSLGKTMLADRLRLKLWGRNLTQQAGEVEFFSGFITPYPHKVHAMYGLEAEYSF